MREMETDCYIGEDRLAYSNRRTYCLTELPVDGLYVHPRRGSSANSAEGGGEGEDDAETANRKFPQPAPHGAARRACRSSSVSR